jgi:hypothetical protein
MFGRIIPTRLPSTIEEMKLIDDRIAKVSIDITQLPGMVASGSLSAQEANYRRAFLSGEIAQLKRYRTNLKLSPSSYGIEPTIFESTKRAPHPNARAPANKYIPTDHSEFTESVVAANYPVQKIPSEWQATEISDMIDVIDIPISAMGPGIQGRLYPDHWPGEHSPGFMHILLELIGEVKTAKHPQVMDPRDVNFTILAYNPATLQRESLAASALTLDNITKSIQVGLNTPNTMGPFGLTLGQQLDVWNGMLHAHMIKARLSQLDDVVRGVHNQTNLDLRRAISLTLKLNNSLPVFTVGDKQLVTMIYNKVTTQITDAIAEAAKLALTQRSGATEIIDSIQEELDYEEGGTVTEAGDTGNYDDYQPISPGTGLPGTGLPGTGLPSVGPGLGGMPSSRKHRVINNRTLNSNQDASFRLAQQELLNSMRPASSQQELIVIRETTLATRRNGAKVDVNTPVATSTAQIVPWYKNVSAPEGEISMYMSFFDHHLAQVGLNQGMFTQQAHNYTAAIVNAMTQSNQSKDPKIMERVFSDVATQLVNSSGLLTDAVHVNIRTNPDQSAFVFFEKSEPMNGLGSTLFKTREAMGRLLG